MSIRNRRGPACHVHDLLDGHVAALDQTFSWIDRMYRCVEESKDCAGRPTGVQNHRDVVTVRPPNSATYAVKTVRIRSSAIAGDVAE